MKRVFLVVLMFSFVLGSIFAALTADGYKTGSVSSDSPLAAKTVVSLNLDEGGDNMVELYFLTSDSKPVTGDGSNIAPTVDLSFKPGSTVATNTSPLYAYWHIVSGDELNVSLQITDPLAIQPVSDDSQNKIQWSAETTEDSGKGIQGATASSNGNKTDVVYTHTGLESEAWAPVTISTADDTDFTGLGKGTYEAYLSLVCSTQS